MRRGDRFSNFPEVIVFKLFSYIREEVTYTLYRMAIHLGRFVLFVESSTDKCCSQVLRAGRRVGNVSYEDQRDVSLGRSERINMHLRAVLRGYEHKRLKETRSSACAVSN